MHGRVAQRASTAVLALAVVGCSGLPTEPITGAGDFRRSFELDGETRSYLVHVPATVDLGRPAPVVLAFHGIPSSAQEMRELADLEAVAASEGFIVVYPEVSRAGDWNHSCRDCSGAAGFGFDDVQFTARVIDKMALDMSIDRRRVYATGFSQGALLTFRLACDLSHRIAAVATVGATMLDWQTYNCEPFRPVPIAMIHGSADEEFPPGGRRGVLVSSVTVDAMVTHWVTTDGCTGSPSAVDLPDVAADGTTVVRTTYAACASGAEVVYYQVEGGGHTWPGSSFDFSPLLGVTSQDLEASQAIADFLLRFTL